MFTLKEFINGNSQILLDEEGPIQKAKFWKVKQSNKNWVEKLEKSDAHKYASEWLPAFGIYRYRESDGFDAKQLVIHKKGSIVKVIGYSGEREVLSQLFQWTLDTLSVMCKGYGVAPSEINQAIHQRKDMFDQWNTDFLPFLPDVEIQDANGKSIKTKSAPLVDGDTFAYLTFQNGVVQITKDLEKPKLIPYKDLPDNRFVWHNSVLPVDYSDELLKDGPRGHFWKLINNTAREQEGRSDWSINQQQLAVIVNAYGYLLHNYYPPNNRNAIILYDRNSDPMRRMGGNGKSLIAQSLKHIKPQFSIDGERAGNCRDKFLWSGYKPFHRVVLFSDTTEKFTLAPLYNAITDGFEVEEKNKDKYVIAPENSPKIVITTNTPPHAFDRSDKRRVCFVPIGDFYGWHLDTSGDDPSDFHDGLLFGPNWSESDWEDYFATCVYCLKKFLDEGLQSFGDKERIEHSRIQICKGDDLLLKEMESFITLDCMGDNSITQQFGTGCFRSDALAIWDSPDFEKYKFIHPKTKRKIFFDLVAALGVEINSDRAQRLHPKKGVRDDFWMMSRPTQTVGDDGDLSKLFEGGDWG